MNEIILPIQNRRSVMAFAPEPIPHEDQIQIFKAGALAPSSYNEQPWIFFVANRNKPDAFERILNTLAPANQEWAKNAGALVVSATKKYYALNGKPNYYALHDLGMATALCIVQAQAMGYVSHIMGGFSHEQVKDILELDDSYSIGAVMALGKPGNIENLSPQNRQRELSPRVRIEIEKTLKFI